MPQKLVTSTAAAAPVALATTCTNYRKLLIQTGKSLDGMSPSQNAGPVSIGNSATAGEQPLILNPGDERQFDEPAGRMMDLQRWFLKVANDGDGVILTYS